MASSAAYRWRCASSRPISSLIGMNDDGDRVAGSHRSRDDLRRAGGDDPVDQARRRRPQARASFACVDTSPPPASDRRAYGAEHPGRGRAVRRSGEILGCRHCHRWDRPDPRSRSRARSPQPPGGSVKSHGDPAQASGCSRNVTSNLVRPRAGSEFATRSAISCATASVVVECPRGPGARPGCGS